LLLQETTVKIKRSSPEYRPWNAARRFTALGTLLAYAVVGEHLVSVGFARELEDSPAANELQQRLAVPSRRYEIQGGSVESVAAAFQAATGVTVSFERDAIRSLPSNGISGSFYAEQALDKMLENTGAAFQFTGPLAVTIVLREQKASIEVVDSAPMISSPRYTEPLRDIPQTIAVIPRALMEQQGATTLTDALRNVPGLTITAGEGGAPAGDNLTLRGFSARNDLFVDGVRDINPQTRDAFNIEQVEVAKGPQSAFSGRGSAGGAINITSKAPNLRRMFGGNIMIGNAGFKRFTADVNVPVKPLGERSAFRMNFLKQDAGTPGRDVVSSNRTGLAPSLAFGLGTPTRITLSYYKLKQDNISDYGIPWVPATNNALLEYRDKPAPVDRNNFYGLANRDYERLNSDSGTAKIEHDFSDSLNFRSQFRYGRNVRDSIATPPRFASNDSTVINRGAVSWITKDQIYDSQTDFRARFNTAKIQHALVAGVGITHENNIRNTRTATAATTTDLYNPTPYDPYTGSLTTGPYTGNVSGDTQAVWAFDTAKFGQHWEATGGFRFERFNVDGVNTTPAPVQQLTKMTSTRAALIYKPIVRGTFYGSYGTSLTPSLDGLTYGVVNTAIPPEKTFTIEAGTKWDLISDRLFVTGALFQVKKNNARTPGVNPDEPPQVLQGVQRVNGIEVSATGSITRNLRVFAAYTLMDGKIIESNTPAEVGRTFQNTPRNSYTVWTTYSLKKLTLGGGPRFVGKRFGNNTNTRWVDNYWTLDIMASYPILKFLDLRFNATNLNNAYYFDRLGGGHLVPGQGRTVLGSTAFRF
jgi:catecholate siderophore receptor